LPEKKKTSFLAHNKEGAKVRKPSHINNEVSLLSSSFSVACDGGGIGGTGLELP